MSPTKRGKKIKLRILRGHVAHVGPGRERKRRLKALNLNVHQWIRWFSLVSVLLMLAITVAAILLKNHYNEYPVRVERDSISAVERKSDSITLEWDETHKSEVYRVFYRESIPEDQDLPGDEDDGNDSNKEVGEIDASWSVAESDVGVVKIDDLKEGTRYSFMIRGDNAEHEGIPTKPRTFMTKKSQSIKVTKEITKLTSSKPFKLDATAETGLVFESSNPEVAEVVEETGEIRITGEGTAEIKVKARETRHIEGDEEEVSLLVLDSEPVSAGGASAHVIYHLSSDNCEVVKRITGAGGAVVPQGLGYTGDKYMVSYGMGSPNRIVSFDVDGDGKDVSVPKISLGHPNGFTYADENGLCYCVKGWSSRAVTYEPSTGDYGSIGLSYGCSGIGYDRKEKLLYTCSRTVMAAYDISNDYKAVHKCGVVRHSGKVYTQDCGGHAGIMMRCLSGASKHGTNYIDLYDMIHGNYLGTLSCDLSEVESAIVDKDGFLEILANNSGSTDYIWKTNINIETIGEGL